jgi:hypothetical protein
VTLSDVVAMTATKWASVIHEAQQLQGKVTTLNFFGDTLKQGAWWPAGAD